jgi:diaminopimelate decarboxylase
MGVPPAKILFNGPYKTKNDIATALLSGAVVNLDSPYEVTLVAQVAQENPEKRLAVGLRCNLDLAETSRSRFGFAVGTMLNQAVEALRNLSNIDLVGLQCHYCTADKSTQLYTSIASAMLELAQTYFPDGGLRFIDLGGGFFSRMEDSLARQFPCPIPSFEDYASAIGPLFTAAFASDNSPQLILEPGLALVADAMSFCVKVIDIKTIDSRNIALVSGSIYDIKPTLNQKKLPFSIVSRDPKPPFVIGEVTDIVGYTCMEHDVLIHGYEGRIEPGDYLIFRQVGAYTVVLRPPFIRPCPPILSIDTATGEQKLASRGETLDDLFARHFPPANFSVIE